MEFLEEAAEAIARAIGLDAAEADQRKGFLEFTDRDAALLRELHGRLGNAQDAFVNAVEGATRMQELINDLLEYSRMDTRGETFEMVSVAAVFQQAVTNLQTLIRETGAVITQDSLPMVMGNPVQYAMVFQNLIGNAVKFRGGNPRASTSRPGGTATHGSSPSGTTGSGSNRNMRSGSSPSSSGFTAGTNIRGPASVWPSAGRSWNDTGGGSGRNPSPAGDPPFSLPFRP